MSPLSSEDFVARSHEEKIMAVDLLKALGELSRITDHMTCNGAMAMELGAFTPYLWLMRTREMLYDLLEEETSASFDSRWRSCRRRGRC